MKNMYANIHAKLIWPIINGRRKAVSMDYSEKIIRSQFNNQSLILNKQLENIRALCEYAYNNTVFYKQSFQKAGLKPGDIKSIEDFSRLPVITREELNKNIDYMIASNIEEQELMYDSTGGTSGLPTKFARDIKCLSRKKAVEERFNTFTGWQRGEKIAYYWPALKDFAHSNKPLFYFIRQKYITREMLIYAGELNEEIMRQHVKILMKFRPHLLRVFPNSLQLLAEFCIREEVSFKIPRG
ncbi:hypothetical protein ACFL3D_06315, partial [Candidatus Omnitrophota bacterium]